ncbi:MAG: nucleotidyltransferase [Elusimicrobia bacterium]|nr:nucleotidyltransferase [Candidatus Liberimonas magnetica]
MIQVLIKKLAEALDRNNIPYMVIGGQAVLLYGSVRLTRDINVTLGIGTDKLEIVKKLCRDLNLSMIPGKSDEFVYETMVLPVEEKNIKIRVDFIFSFSEYEKQAINRVNRVIIEDYPVKFTSMEDLIVHKIFAGRAVDLEDIKNILIKNNDKINYEYIKKCLKEFFNVPGKENMLKDFIKLKDNIVK